MTTRNRKANRAKRRAEYQTAKVLFLLEGGHKDWIPSFSHNWRAEFSQLMSHLSAYPNSQYRSQRHASIYPRIPTPNRW